MTKGLSMALRTRAEWVLRLIFLAAPQRHVVLEAGERAQLTILAKTMEADLLSITLPMKPPSRFRGLP